MQIQVVLKEIRGQKWIFPYNFVWGLMQWANLICEMDDLLSFMMRFFP